MSLFQAMRAGGISRQALFVSASTLTGAATIASCGRDDAMANDAYNAASLGEQQNSVARPLRSFCLRNEHAKHVFRLPERVTDESNLKPMILATSPMTTHANDTSLTQKRQSRWEFHWWPYHHNSGDEKSETTWFQRISKSIFVITRGVEIVIRLSPLLILAPTAVFVSSANSFVEWMVRRPKKYGIISTSSSIDDGDLFVHQFEMARITTVYPDETWASNLAWRYTLHTIQSLGPAFCKLGQWAATRRDLFPLRMCNKLSELHDMASIHSLEHTRSTLENAFGDYEAKGLTVNDIILGSGSAAQVYRGILSSQGKTKTVAIKVLHPNTRQMVERDLKLMQHVADLIDTYIPLEIIRMLSLPRAVDNFCEIMKRQLDLRIEGDNLRTFRSNFDCSGNSEIEFPNPSKEFVSEHVLVEDYIEAKPISVYLADDSPKGLEVRRKLAGPLLRAFLKMVFIDNFVHADLHPGNVLVQECSSENRYKIMFLDAGIAMSLQPRDQKNLSDLFKAVVLNDGYSAGSLMVERARYERCSSIPGGKHAFASGVANIVSEFHDRSKQGLTLGAVRVGSLLGRVLDLCRKYGVEIDPAMAAVVVSMLVLEGLGRSLDPDLNLMKAAMPFLLRKV